MVSNTLPDDDQPDAADGPASGCDGASDTGGPCGSGLDQIHPTTAVRYGLMRYIGEFSRPPDMKSAGQAKLVVQTKRGIEIGEQVSLTCPGGSQCVSRGQILDFTACSGSAYCEPNCGKILRQASQDDLAEYDHISASAKAKRDLCQQMACEHNLDIKVVACEPLFGGERIIFYFVADGRVDFRALVKDLAREFQTRIEMRQVGTRDEARLVADYETCGRECCCRTFLKSLKPVNMKMAKLQKATLDPSKVSGRCGRLKCCLRYEHTGYEELDARLPKVGAEVTTRYGCGTVTDRQILTQLLQIDTEDGGRLAIGIEGLVSPDEAATRAQAPEPRFPRSKDGQARTPVPEPGAETRAGGATGRRRRKRGGFARTPDTPAGPAAEPPPVDRPPSAPAASRPADAAAGTTPGQTPKAADEAAAAAPDGAARPEAGSQDAPAATAPAEKEGGSRRRRRRRRPRGRRAGKSGGGHGGS